MVSIIHKNRIGVDPAAGPSLDAVILAQRERCRTLVEMAEKSKFFYAELDGYNEKDAAKHLTAEAGALLAVLADRLRELPDWSTEALHAAVNGFAEARGLGLGKIAQPIRVAVAGMAISPPIDQTLALLGRERTLSRLQAAVQYTSAAAAASRA